MPASEAEAETNQHGGPRCSFWGQRQLSNRSIHGVLSSHPAAFVSVSIYANRRGRCLWESSMVIEPAFLCEPECARSVFLVLLLGELAPNKSLGISPVQAAKVDERPGGASQTLAFTALRR